MQRASPEPPELLVGYGRVGARFLCFWLFGSSILLFFLGLFIADDPKRSLWSQTLVFLPFLGLSIFLWFVSDLIWADAKTRKALRIFPDELFLCRLTPPKIVFSEIERIEIDLDMNLYVLHFKNRKHRQRFVWVYVPMQRIKIRASAFYCHPDDMLRIMRSRIVEHRIEAREWRSGRTEEDWARLMWKIRDQTELIGLSFFALIWLMIYVRDLWTSVFLK